MCMIGNVILAIAEIALTPGTIPELQFRIGNIRATTDGTPMGVWRFYGSNRCLVRSGSGEWNCTGFLLLFCLFPEQASGVDSPGEGEQIGYILAKEQEIVGKCYQGEQIVWEHGGNALEEGQIVNAIKS